MPQFNQIDAARNIDQSLSAGTYLSGLDGVAERNRVKQEKQQKIANAVQLAMQRLGHVGNKATVSEDGVVDMNFNPFNNIKAERSDFGKFFDPTKPQGINSTAEIQEKGTETMAALVSGVASKQPIGTGGIAGVWNQASPLPGQIAQILGTGGTSNTPDYGKLIADMVEKNIAVSGRKDIAGNFNVTSGLTLNATDATKTTTTKNSEVTDAHNDYSVRNLEAAAILEKAFGIDNGPVAKMLEQKYKTIANTDMANSTDGTTQTATAGVIGGSSQMSIGFGTSVGNSTSISTSVSGPTNSKQDYENDFQDIATVGAAGNNVVQSTKLQFDTNNQIKPGSLAILRTKSWIGTGSGQNVDLVLHDLRNPKQNERTIKSEMGGRIRSLVAMAINSGLPITFNGKVYPTGQTPSNKEIDDYIYNRIFNLGQDKTEREFLKFGGNTIKLGGKEVGDGQGKTGAVLPAFRLADVDPAYLSNDQISSLLQALGANKK